MTRIQALILLVSGSLLYFFNSCSSEFVANSTLANSMAATCKAVNAPPMPQSRMVSPFAQGKLVLNHTRQSTSQKATAATKYLAIIDNNCLRGADDTALAKNFAGSSQIVDDWNQQPYILSQAENELIAMENQINSDPCIVGVSPNRIYRPSAIATYLNDPSITTQQHLVAINYEGALQRVLNAVYGFNVNAIASPVVVAVLDSGVNYNHPDLVNVIQNLPQGPGVLANTLGTGNVVYDGRDITPEGHGSHVAGLIAAQGNNALGGTGTAPYGVKILPVNVFFVDNGDVVSDSVTIIKGINFAAQQRVSSINMSVGGNGDDPAVKAAIQAAIAANVFVVASAGNIDVENPVAYEIGNAMPVFPAIYGGELAGMVTVGSTDSSTGAKSYFSLYSNTLVEMAAPGSQTRTVGLYSTSLNSSYAVLQGTSMAAPVLTGAAALAQSFYRYHYNADLTPAAVEDLLKASATKNPALAPYIKDGNSLNMSQLIQTLQSRYPLTAGGANSTSNPNCP